MTAVAAPIFHLSDRPPAAPSALDKTSQATVLFLKTEDPDAFDHLVAICWRAKGDLFVFDRSERLYWATRKWIQVWILEKLEPYRRTSNEVIDRAAANGEFRYLGRSCRLAMVDEIRRCRATKRQRYSFVSANWDLTRCAPEKQTISELDIALFLWRNRTEFETYLGKLFSVLRIEVCGCLDGVPKGAITQRVAKHFGINVRQAGAYRTQLKQRLSGSSLPRYFLN
jgi:hypothetical protein